MRDKFARFMVGRYGSRGVDELTKLLVGLTMILMAANLYFRLEALNTLVLVGLFLTYFRLFSRNIPARYAENMKLLGIKSRIRGFFDAQKRKAADRKVNHIYKCPSCGQKIRIPKGKGKIVVTCPNCRNEFEKKS